MRVRHTFAYLGLLLFACLRAVPAEAGPLMVFEAETGKVILSDNAGAPWYPASLTKLMTAYLAFHAVRDGKLKMSSKLRVSAHALSQPPSKIGFPVGATPTLRKALELLIVRSTNDVAVTIAEGVAGSEERFVKLMNAWARRLGMTGTYFANPHGLPDPRQISTARDLAILTRAIITQFPEYQDLFTQTQVKVGNRRFRAWNKLLKEMPGADGMKTGFICSSGFNLVGSATRGGRRLVAVVLGAKSSKARTTLTQSLLEKGFRKNGYTGKTITDYTNGGLFTSGPKDMKSVVCKKKSDAPLTSPWRVHGWGVEFGRFADRGRAHDVLRDNMMALRNVIYTGRGGVVKDYRTKDLAAVMYGFPESQAREICAYFAKSGTGCRTFEPNVFKPPKKAKKKATGKKRTTKKKRRKKTTIRKKKSTGKKSQPRG